MDLGLRKLLDESPELAPSPLVYPLVTLHGLVVTLWFDLGMKWKRKVPAEN